MSIHPLPHPLAGRTVTVDLGYGDGPQPYVVEDWWDRVGGGSWMDAASNPACLKYAMRSAMASLPLDNEVVYGKSGLGHLVHDSELGDAR